MRLFALCALFAVACDPTPPPPVVTLDPPAPGEGFQMATGEFEVPARGEVQRCYFFQVPGSGTAPLWVSRTVATQNVGSHHFNIFRVKTVVGLDGKHGDVVDGGECWKSANWADWPLVMNDQDSQPGHNVVDWTLPDGVAHKFTPGEKLMLQIHFVNATTQKTPNRGKGIINFYYYPHNTQPPMELGTVFATNQNIRICPGDKDVEFKTTCRFAQKPVTIIGANGHFHSRGTRFQIGACDSNNEPLGDMFYTSRSWDEPPFVRDLHVAIPQSGGIVYTCDYSMPSTACGDPTRQCCVTFGGKVETQEHCNAFVYYYPKVDDASCF